jgi:prenylcysteine oxidase/farnesylcysteine lyase
VKIFSEAPVEDKWLQSLFNGQVGWVHRAEFDAYPKLPPTSIFPPVKLDTGFYYVNAFEPFISTMETETLASRNVVDLLLNEEFGGASICGPRISGSTKEAAGTDSDFVFGWDC